MLSILFANISSYIYGTYSDRSYSLYGVSDPPIECKALATSGLWSPYILESVVSNSS